MKISRFSSPGRRVARRQKIPLAARDRATTRWWAPASRRRQPGAPGRIEVDDPNIPRGSQYLLVTAAASAEVFFDPKPPPCPDAETRAHLAKRKELRLGIFIEEPRVSDPDSAGALRNGQNAIVFNLAQRNSRILTENYIVMWDLVDGWRPGPCGVPTNAIMSVNALLRASHHAILGAQHP